MDENFGIYIRHGYGQIDNKDVLISYFHNKDFIEVLPLSKTEYLPLIPPHSSISLKFAENIYKSCFVRIKNATTNDQHGYTGEIDYLCKLHDDSEKISDITIISDEIDSVFNPLIYYYNARQSGEYDNPDLLYDSVCIHQFNCNYKGELITISVNYGHVFSRGIGSDLKAHAQLRIHMVNSITVDETYNLYCAINEAIRTLRCNNDSNVLRVDLCRETENNRIQCIGRLRGRAYIRDKDIAYRQLDYSTIMHHSDKLFQQAISDYSGGDIQDNKLFDLDVYKTPSWVDFTNIFIAFENECKRHKGLEKDDSSIESIREQIQSEIKTIQPKDEEEKGFLKDINSLVANHGKSYGQKKKISLAYEMLEQCLKTSIESLLYEDQLSETDEDRIKRAIDKIVSMRNACLHGDDLSAMDRYQQQCVIFLQIMTYSMMLKRANIDDKAIELWIGQVFHCNYEYYKLQEERLKEKSQVRE